MRGCLIYGARRLTRDESNRRTIKIIPDSLLAFLSPPAVSLRPCAYNYSYHNSNFERAGIRECGRRPTRIPLFPCCWLLLRLDGKIQYLPAAAVLGNPPPTFFFPPSAVCPTGNSHSLLLLRRPPPTTFLFAPPPPTAPSFARSIEAPELQAFAAAWLPLVALAPHSLRIVLAPSADF